MKNLPKTNQQMLKRLAARSDGAWVDFVSIYESALKRFCASRGLSHEDALEVCQEVLAALDKSLVQGKYDPERGGFRNWLFRIARNLSVNKICERSKQVNAGGGSSIQKLNASLPDNQDISEAVWLEYRRSLTSWAAAQIKPISSEQSWACFWETAVVGRCPNEVAMELGISVGAVYTAKSRIITRFRKLVSDLDSASVEELPELNEPLS